MLTMTEKNLIRLLKSLGLDREATLNITTLAKTDEIREMIIQLTAELYMEKGEVTEQDILKIILMLTGSRKKSNSNEDSEQ